MFDTTSAKKLLREAKWIWPDLSFYDLYNTYAHFRKDFQLDAVEPQSMLYITADQSYRLWINGKYATRGPARGYQVSWPYDEIDVSPYLKEGRNYISVEVYNPGISTFSYISQSRAGLICSGSFGGNIIKTDETWLTRLDTSHKRDTARYSTEIGFQEHVDTVRDDRRWIYSEEPPSAGWHMPGDIINYGAMPWFDLEERGIPQLGETLKTPVKVMSRASGMNSGGYKEWRNIASGLYEEFKKLDFMTDGTGLAGACKVNVPASGDSRCQVRVLDMGEMVVGPISMEAEGGEAGGIIDIFCHECLFDGLMPVLADPGTNCKVSMTNRLILSGANVSYDFYQMLGFRYITLVIRDNPDRVSIGLKVSDTAYPYEIKGSFECSDKTLNDIWRMCLRTEQVCSLDAYVDTPWREQAQWWGDARIQFANSMVMDNDVRLLKRGIRSIAGQRVPNGLTYGHAPTMAHNCILPDFSLVWIVTLLDYYWQTKDITLFEEQLPRIREVLAYFKDEASKHKGLICHDNRFWLFLDWSELEREGGAPTLYNMWYLMALRAVSKLLVKCGKLTEAADLEMAGAELQSALENQAFDKAAGLFCDMVYDNGTCSKKHSVHAQAFAMMLGLMPGYHQNMMGKRILPFLRGEKLDVPMPSAYWASYVINVAREQGYFDEAVSFIKVKWSPMLPLSTCTEIFDTVPGVFSCSHAWSAHPLFHLVNILGGIVQETEGWDSIKYEPYLSRELSFVKAVQPTGHGLIESFWERNDEGVKVVLSLPEGVTARVRIPGFEGTVKNRFHFHMCLNGDESYSD